MNLCNEQSETVDHKGPVDTGVVRVLKIIEKYVIFIPIGLHLQYAYSLILLG